MNKINKNPLALDEVPGFCSLLFHNNILSMSQFVKIKKLQKIHSNDPELCEFKTMAESCVCIIQQENKYIQQIEAIFNNCVPKDFSLPDYYKFTANVVKFLDPDFIRIPVSLYQVSLVIKYL